MVKKAIVATFILGILIGAAGGAAFYYFAPPKTVYIPAGAQGAGTGISGGTGGTSGGTPTGGAPAGGAGTDYYWNLISKDLAESSCLSEAKEYAGSNAFAVLDCKCSEAASAAEKKYSCAVSTLVGEKQLSVDCVKAAGKCSILSEYSNTEMTFEELYALIN